MAGQGYRSDKVRLKKQNIGFSAWIKGVNKNGRLVTESAGVEEFSLGEVQWVMT